MKTTFIRVKNEDDKRLKDAAEIIKRGGLVIFPTETVYGLGANALDAQASSRIYKAKGRPSDNPLIIHIARPEDAEKYAYTSPLYYKLSERFMPGPITVIMKKRDIIPVSVTGGLDSVAVRCPVNKTARKLIELSGVPIAAPSANISGRPSPTKAEHCVQDMDSRVDMIIDGGPCEVGVESTIVSVLDGKVRLLRPGRVTLEELREVCGDVEVDDAVVRKMKDNEHPLAPGMKYRHYAPKAPVWAVTGTEEKVNAFFRAREVEKCGILCYDEDAESLPQSELVLTFGHHDDLEEQAKLLFDALRRFDSLPVREIYARLPSDSGIGFAVRNRLVKACGFNAIDLDKVKVVGICGSIGSGKSTFARELERLGAFRIDCDEVYSVIVGAPGKCIDELRESFGENIVLPDGSLDRKALSEEVFSNSDKLELLDLITHKYISAEVDRLILEGEKLGRNIILVEAPLLFESGFDKKCDTTVAVTAPESVKLERITARDGCTVEEARARLYRQLDDITLSSKSDKIIVNDTDENGLIKSAESLYKELNA